MRMRWVTTFAASAFLIAAGWGSAAARRQSPPPASKFKLTTNAFSDGGRIPTRFSCVDPKADSPRLAWSNPPAGTMSFAVIMHDVDTAPRQGTMDVTHWIFWNVPASATSLPAGIKPGTSPDGIRQGKNIRQVDGYLPVCPPPGSFPHHYIIEMYALNTELDLAAGSTRMELLKAMDGHVIGESAYVGRFGR
ncbi:MAG TPA: YbhB/YbcL family Raf kinase inhibitor-like protein [Patescibacteria group bacterium]|nr:YbhB/YbcL family Raf kinase inhibitor-like protein [Patescibacteria group bacterium]